MKQGLLFFCFLFLQQLCAQSENQPVERSIKVAPESKSLLKIPKDNALPDFLKKDFLKNAPNPNETPKRVLKKIYKWENARLLLIQETSF